MATKFIAIYPNKLFRPYFVQLPRKHSFVYLSDPYPAMIPLFYFGNAFPFAQSH